MKLRNGISTKRGLNMSIQKDGCLKKIVNFDFRVAIQIEGSIYRIKQAKELYENPKKPHVIDEKHICFWHDGCVDHPECIQRKNILFN